MQELFADSVPYQKQAGMATYLHPQTKILLTLATIIAALVFRNFYALGVFAIGSTFYMLSTKKYKAAALTYVFVMAMWVLSLFNIWLVSFIFPALWENLTLKSLAAPFLRVVISMNMVLGMALTMRVEQAQAALYSLHLPGMLTLPLTVMIRFIPAFVHDIKQVHQALRLRGYNLTPLSTFMHPYLVLRMAFVPLIFRALRTAEDLAVAAELKGIDHKEKPLELRHEKFSTADWTACALWGGCILAGVLLVQFTPEAVGPMSPKGQ